MLKLTVQAEDLDALCGKLFEVADRLSLSELKTEGGAEVSLTSVNEEEDNLEEKVEQALYKVEETGEAEEVVEHAIGLELDADGIPWDERIHSGSKKQVKAGTWALRRGVDKDLVDQIKAELKQKVVHLQNPPTVPEAPVAADTPVIESPVHEVAQPVMETPVAQVVTEQAAPLPIPGASGHTLASFKENFPMVFSGLITEGKIDQGYVNQLKAHFQVQEIWEMNDEQKEMIFTQFVSHGIIQAVG